MAVGKDCNVCSDFSTMRKTNAKKMNSQKIDTDIVCPPDSSQLGQSTWTFLHTMAAYYPDNASTLDQSLMKGFIDGVAKFYPCGYCAEHLQREIVANPPKVCTKEELSAWFCQIHNEVNERQGKPKFDCSKVFERWKNGPPGADCYPM